MTALLRRAKPGVPPELPATFHAPLFGEVIAGLGGKQRIVLDLGAASTPMLALLGRAHCRVEVADVAHFGGIRRLNAASGSNELERAANSLFPNRLSNDALDVVFCWDLLNYLALDSLASLMDAIAARARPGALAHALIHYADREMGESPAHFVPTPDAGLADQGARGPRIPAPRFSPEELGKHMGRFAIDRARLLSNGMQEFLFQLQS